MEKKNSKKGIFLIFFYVLLGCIFLIFGAVAGFISVFEKTYKNRAFPNVYINNQSFGGKTEEEITHYWLKRNADIDDIRFELTFEQYTATISATDIGLTYDATLSAHQALSVGRSPYNFLSNLRERYFREPINLNPSFTWNGDALDMHLALLSTTLTIPVENGLFHFSQGKVTEFQPSHAGRSIDLDAIKQQIRLSIPATVLSHTFLVRIPIPIHIIEPDVSTDNANTFGIKERIGKGYSEFGGSIAGRIHNVALAASILNGVLIAPGETFSFNKTVGDISAATGYQSAYIIKDGRTVLGDGGGVCQVSTTLFRAALDAGLPIVERHEHSYRVHYYEEDGTKAGMDATVFNPSDDLKFTNDTSHYILIQTKTDTTNLTLTFELYGASDGRKAQILNHVVGGITPPPADLYQDDPTLPAGVIKQVDFAAWGAKASFEYKVIKNGTVTIDQIFTSNYRPWQAVYLRGTKQ